MEETNREVELEAQPEIEGEESTNGYLAGVIGCTIRQITRYRTAKELPPAGSSKDDVIRFLFDLARYPPGQKDLEERKLEEQIKKLEIENQLKLERYVDKDKVLEYFRNFTEYAKKVIIQELENLEGKITCPPEYREANNQGIRNSRNSILGLLSAYQDFG